VIVGIGCWRGSGATTTSVALAAAAVARGQAPWLIEADPAGGVLAARFQRGTVEAGALEHVAFPDTRSTAVERFHAAAADVHGIRVVTAAGDPFRAWACHSPRTPWAPALRELDGPVLVDLGRLRGATPTGDVIEQCDVVLLVTDTDAISIVATLDWADARGRVSPSDTAMPVDRTLLAVLDAPTVHHPIGRADIEAELGPRFAGWLPWDPAAVRAVHAGVPLTDRRLRRSDLAQAALHLTDQLGLAPSEVAA
jgi:MinD-like ATPase involved in chromosome partitioning or flagellar assembly